MLDLAIGQLLRATPHFKGKGRLTQWFVRGQTAPRRLMAHLPGGVRVACDLSIPYEAMVWLGFEERDDLAALATLLHPGDTFLDCGANIGLWTLNAARLVGETGSVLSFEPNPATFAKLKTNIELNAVQSNVSPMETALGDHEGTVDFACEGEHNISHIADSATPGTRPVRIATLDTLAGTRTIHGMKIDVEGHELAVLRGAEQILSRHKPWIIIEFNTTALASRRLGDFPPHQHLTGLGYTARPLIPTKGARNAMQPLDDGFEVQGYQNLVYQP